MKIALSTLRAGLPLATLGVMTLASCSMPPRDAWNQIQNRGLISYYTAKPSGAPLVTSTAPLQVAASNTAVNKPTTTTSPAASPAPRQTDGLPVARVVNELPGYVRSPHTSPGRLVDVRGMAAGSKVVCPYTQKPFLVPNGIRKSSSTTPQVAARRESEASRTNTVTTSDRPSTKPAPKTTPPANSNVAALTRPAPEPKLDSLPTPAVQTPSGDLPYGSSIQGRPGFVNSPYAAKHQLVDVTGLPVGMEVKCPYTGKLFRVPPQ